MKHLLLLFTCFGLSAAFAQSISGNLNSASTKNALGYGNVDIYKGDELVASVLTDRLGNFNVALDTGTYRCVVNYAGYEPVTKEIHVSKDETADFSVEEDPSKPRRPETEKAEVINGTALRRSSSSAFVKYYPSGSIPAPKASYFGADSIIVDADYYYGEDAGTGTGEGKKATSTGTSRALTAGEINDFAKWKLWQDITASELSSYQTSWNIAPKGRYTVELHGTTGLPLADAIVRLVQRGGATLFTARTDNTGKAELWLTIKNENPTVPGGLQLEIDYQGKTSRISNVKPFEQSLNHLVLDVTCEQSENVDIAFVVDATGSMGDELSYLQAEMNDIVFQSKQISSKLNFRFANVFYRDLGANEAYTTRSMDFNRILSESVNYISDQAAGGGGDYEEAVEIALDSAINHLSWSTQAWARVLFLILDAPPHNTPENQQKLRQLIAQAAEKGIRIVPIGASGINKSTEYLMRCLALGTNGTYTFLTDHSGIGNSHIAPSTDQFDVELLNQVMVRILKSYTYMPDCGQNLPALNLDYPDSLVIYPPLPPAVDSTDTTLTPIPADPPADSMNVSWKYYPNPTDGIVNVTSDRDIAELYVTDLSGKVLQIIANLEKDRTVRIYLGAYATGIYLIRYPLGKTWVSGKVVLQR